LEGVVGTGWSWLRIGTDGGHLWVRWGTFWFHKYGEFLDWLQSLLVSFSRRTLLHGVNIVILGTRWRRWLRHCATSREVARSITDGVIEIFYRHILSVRTMALGLTQPLTEMSTRNISWG
jgi:hypothetical protein